MIIRLAIKKLKTLGFSLIELSVVLIIVGILLYGALSVGMAQMEMDKIKATEAKLQKIENAITVFYKLNNYLPCPANGSTLISEADFGVGTRSDGGGGTTNTTCDGTNVIRDIDGKIYAGVVPVMDLSLPGDFMFDSWGNRISYIVSKNCVDNDNWVSTNTYKCSDEGTTHANGGKVHIIGVNGQEIPMLEAYVIISHGKDNIGAWPRAGGSKVAGDPNNTYTEKNNGNLNSDGVPLENKFAVTVYYDKAINDGGAPNGGGPDGNYFDDIVRWKTPLQVEYDALH